MIQIGKRVGRIYGSLNSINQKLVIVSVFPEQFEMIRRRKSCGINLGREKPANEDIAIHRIGRHHIRIDKNGRVIGDVSAGVFRDDTFGTIWEQSNYTIAILIAVI